MVGRIRYAAGVLAGLGVCAVGGQLHAQSATAPSATDASPITVKSMTTQIYKAPDMPAVPKRYEGAGATDAAGVVATIGGEQRIFYTFTQSRAKPNANRQDMQGAFGIVKLAADGTLAPVVPLTQHARRIGNNRERNFMKPMVEAIGALPNGDTRHIVTLISTEQNGNAANLGDLTGLTAQNVIGKSNGNPQVVALVQDAATGKLVKEYNIITLLLKSIGQDNDQQQWGTPEITPVPNADGSLPTGDAAMGISFQRNNQTCWMGVAVVKADGTIEAKSLLKNENQCQHGKPSANFVPGSVTAGGGASFFTAHVRADDQPAEIGIAADIITYSGGTGAAALKKTASKLIAKSVVVDQNDKRKNKYATQPTVAMVQGATGPIMAVTYALANPSRANKANGHAGAANITNIVTLDAKLTQLDLKTSGAVKLGGARHARGWETEYGQVDTASGKGMPAVAVLAGSSIGAGAAGYNVTTIDPTTGKMAETTADRVFTIATNSDIAGFATMGKTNPQDQAGAFLNLVRGSIKNTSTKYPEVTKFAVTLVPGPEDAAKSTRDSLYLSLVPQTWLKAVKVNPGGAAPAEQVPSGPTPVAATPPPASFPVDPSNADPTVGSGTDDTASGGSSDPSDPSSSGGSSDGVYGRKGAEASSCSVSAPSGNGGLGGLALVGIGLALAAARRKKGQ